LVMRRALRSTLFPTRRSSDLVFGIPGVHTVELYRGLPNTNIRHVTPRHEQGAGFMADGYYRASGKVGVCFIITGPGMTNIMTARSEEHTSELQSRENIVCRLL